MTPGPALPVSEESLVQTKKCRLILLGLDIFLCLAVSGKIAALFSGQACDVTSIPVTIYTLGNGSNTNMQAAGEFNQDGILDIVVVNAGFNSITIFFGTDGGSFGSTASIATDFLPFAVAVGDFNNGTYTDIVVSNGYSNKIAVILALGNGAYATPINFTTGSEPESIFVVDVNNNNRLDVIVVNYYSNCVSVLLGFDGGRFAAVGDFNNDNWTDLVVTNNSGGTLSIYFGFGDGAFTNQHIWTVGDSPVWIAVGDFNQDNRLNIVVSTYGCHCVEILLGLGNRNFQRQTTIFSGYIDYACSTIVTDFNNDNYLDVSIANFSLNQLGIFLISCL
ncbi:unnamed protein product [Rotaria magnacalcarata]|uniref:VCBS repeat-containing protein n=4 Tax=Rotaria magnacalcarata TaxID=392030 RepID=A0A8S2P0B3_9BILA|nr:unnamed protein product [Rotaria magnacalcarata]